MLGSTPGRGMQPELCTGAVSARPCGGRPAGTGRVRGLGAHGPVCQGDRLPPFSGSGAAAASPRREAEDGEPRAVAADCCRERDSAWRRDPCHDQKGEESPLRENCAGSESAGPQERRCGGEGRAQRGCGCSGTKSSPGHGAGRYLSAPPAGRAAGRSRRWPGEHARSGGGAGWCRRWWDGGAGRCGSPAVRGVGGRAGVCGHRAPRRPASSGPGVAAAASP